MNLLLIEPNRKNANKLKKLISPYFQIDHIVEPLEAIPRIRNKPYNLLLSKIQLPTLNGISLSALIKRENKDLPIILLNGERDEKIKSEIHSLGIEEYLEEPVDEQILLFKMLSLAKKTQKQTSKNYLQTKTLFLDINNEKTLYKGKIIQLYRKEFELLTFLIKNRAKVLTKTEILEYLWGYDVTAITSTVEVHVYRLRKKLMKRTRKNHIQTIARVGYQFSDD